MVRTVGRLMNQDQIGLLGGDNLYWFGPNAAMWLDPQGLAKRSKKGEIFADSKGLSLEVRNFQDLSHISDCTLRYMAEEGVTGTTKGGRVKMWEMAVSEVILEIGAENIGNIEPEKS